MSNYAGPEIPNDGLVCMLDAANPKSYNPAENLALYSQTFTNGVWGKSNCTAAVSTVLYNNGTAVTLIAETTTASVSHVLYQALPSITGTYTVSGYFKAAGRTKAYIQLFSSGGNAVAFFDLTAGTIYNSLGTTSIENQGNGWFKVTASITFTAAVPTIYFVLLDNAGSSTYTGDGTSGMFVYGIQVNTGSYVKPFTPTTASAVAASTTWTDISGNNNNGTSTSLSVAALPTVGNVVDFNTSSVITASFSSPVDKNSWSLQYWVRSTGLTPSDYRGIVQLVEPNASFGYFYNVDTRQTTNTYVLGYQKDYLINDWLTYGYMTQAQWTAQGWWCLGVSYNNKVFRFYTNGQFVNTQTQTRNVDGYGNLTQMKINYSGSNTVYMGPIQFYRGILTDNQFAQSFQAYRGRFGI